MAGLPAFLNLVEIEIEQLLPASAQHVDPDFREPRTVKARAATITLFGQVNYGSKKFEKRDNTLTGDREASYGWLVFEKAYLDDLVITLKKGDRITKIAGVTVDHLLDEVRYESPLEGVFLLVYAVFNIDRPDRESIKS